MTLRQSLRSIPFGAWVGLVSVVLLLLPSFLSEFQVSLVTEMLIAGLFALSLNLIMGYGGMVHFGHAAFYGVGGYAFAILTSRYGLAPLVALLIAPFISALFGVVIGWFCVRRTRLYFSILTLAFGQLLHILAFQSYDFTGGDNGIQGLPTPDFLVGTTNYYVFVVVIFMICFALIRLLVQTPFILTLRAIRENPERAQFIGVDVRRHQLITFVIGAFFAGVAGALIAEHHRFVAVDMFFWTTSSEPILGSLLGGMFSLTGPAVGGALLIFLEITITRFTEFWPFILGVITVLIVLVAPGGIVGLIQGWFGEAKKES